MRNMRGTRTTRKARHQEPSFRERVFAVVKKIPAGCVLTYKDVAHRTGAPLAARAVGGILKGNYDPRIPCHRVIRSDGTPGGYN
ncbi:MAG: MGMT family protein, partial [Patescibacteria group bacterium]